MFTVTTIIVSLVLSGPPAWKDGDLAVALKASKGTPVFVYVHAQWCAPCNQLSNEVIDTPHGGQLLQLATGLRVDFDTPAGRAITEKYGVINLPTVLVISAEGHEVGRVEGYPGRVAWVRALDDARFGRIGLVALAKAVTDSPGDMQAIVAHGNALLVRGQEAEAKPMLEKAMAAGGQVGARAARIYGRWLLRVKRKAPEATAHFLKYMQKYKGQKASEGFLYWAARGYHFQGKKAEALKLFDTWIGNDPRSYRAAIYKAGFMALHGYDTRETEVVVRFAIGLDDTKATAHYLLADMLLRKNDRVGAEAAIRRAMSIEPKKAMFQNFARKRLGITK